MIPKSENRFSEKIMPNQKRNRESDLTQLNRTLGTPLDVIQACATGILAIPLRLRD